MQKESIIKTCITPHFKLEIDTEDGNPPKVWRLAYTYKAIAKIEQQIGKDIKRIEDWKDLSNSQDFPYIVWGGLDKYNPEVTLDEVMEVLNPECRFALGDAIFDLIFPWAREAFEKALKAQEESGASANPNE